MSYTPLDYKRLRRAIDADSITLPDSEAADIFAESASLYTGVASIRAGTRVIALTNIAGSSSKLTSYRANNSQEDLSDVFDHVMGLAKFWQGILDKAVVDEEQASGSASATSVRVPVVAAW